MNSMMITTIVNAIKNILKKDAKHLLWEGRFYGYYRSATDPDKINRIDINVSHPILSRSKVETSYTTNGKDGKGRGTMRFLEDKIYFEIECTLGNYHHMDYMIVKNVEMQEVWMGVYASIRLDTQEPWCGAQIITRNCYEPNDHLIMEKLADCEKRIGNTL